MSNWLIVLGIGIGTYAARVSFIGGLGKRRLPRSVERALTYVAPAVFAALVLPAVLFNDGAADVTPTANPRFLAAVVAAVVGFATKSVAAVFVIGMVTLWLLDSLT
jgi:branched-subunit amino acid transport protein